MRSGNNYKQDNLTLMKSATSDDIAFMVEHIPYLKPVDLFKD